MASFPPEEKVARAINELRDLRPRLTDTTSELTRILENMEEVDDKNSLIYSSSEYWIKVAYRNAFIRCRLIIDQNLNFIETFGFLAVARYVFELLVWLRLLSAHQEYGFAFFARTLDVKIRESEDQKTQLEAEIAFFEELQNDESSRLHDSFDQEILGGVQTAISEKIVAIGYQVWSEIDRRAHRNFCLYADRAKVNGYGFQAHLMRQQILPKIQDRIDELEKEREKFRLNCLPSARRFLNRRWNWHDEAASVGMRSQYKFLYSYTSRLLHAEPVSFFTDQKNLETPEVGMLLEYVYVSMLDALDLGQKILAKTGAH